MNKLKYLEDDLGRLVGSCPYDWGTGQIVEYGDRDQDGVLHVQGRATVKTISGLNGTNMQIATDRELRHWEN